MTDRRPNQDVFDWTPFNINLNKVGLRGQISSKQKKSHSYHAKMSLMVLRKFTHIWLSILWLTKHACDLWNKNRINGFYQFLNKYISNISKNYNTNVNLSLASQTKRDNMFSDLKSDHIFSQFLVTYLVYIHFLLVCGNYPLTSKRVRCRNLL